MSDQDKFDEFEREVEILSSLAHPHIIQFFGACLKPPRVGILMEYCSKGEILDFVLNFRKQYLNQYPIPEKIRLIIEVCSALEYCHTRNVIHRDLKCENVLINDNNSTKLMDFGLSRAVERMSVKKTKRIGTSIYMAPELVLQDNYDEKCDVFSLGIMMYVLLRGNPHAYGGVDEFQIELKVANNPEFRPNMDKLELPNYDWMKDLISRCLLHEPEERYSCKKIREILKKRGLEDVIDKKNINISLEDQEKPPKSCNKLGTTELVLSSVHQKEEDDEERTTLEKKLMLEVENLKKENERLRKEIENKINSSSGEEEIDSSDSEEEEDDEDSD